MEDITQWISHSIYENGFCILDDVLSLELQTRLLHELDSLKPNLTQANIGQAAAKHLNSEVRKDKIHWLEPETTLYQLAIHPFLDDLITAINRRCYLGINETEFMVACYAPNDFYKKHRDAFVGNDARKLTLILYLNPNWKTEDGGELILYVSDSNAVTVAPKGGRLVVFESYLEHEVLPTQNFRYSITGWLKRV